MYFFLYNVPVYALSNNNNNGNYYYFIKRKKKIIIIILFHYLLHKYKINKNIKNGLYSKYKTVKYITKEARVKHH